MANRNTFKDITTMNEFWMVSSFSVLLVVKLIYFHVGKVHHLGVGGGGDNKINGIPKIA